MEALMIFMAVFGSFLVLINFFVIKDKDTVKLVDWLEDHSNNGPDIGEIDSSIDDMDISYTAMAPGVYLHNPFYRGN